MDAGRLFALFPTSLGAHQSRGRPHVRRRTADADGRFPHAHGNPYAILLDEPSEGVAPVIVEAMADMIVALKANSVSILFAAKSRLAALVADRAYVWTAANSLFSGPLSELRANEEIRRAYLEV